MAALAGSDRAIQPIPPCGMPIGESAVFLQVVVAEATPLRAQFLAADLAFAGIGQLSFVGLRILLDPSSWLRSFRGTNAKR